MVIMVIDGRTKKDTELSKMRLVRISNMPTTQTTTNLPSLDIPVSVSYTRSARAKYLRITIKPTQTITVTVPKHTTHQQAQQFLQSKISWIKKHLQKIEQYNKLQNTPDMTIDLDKAQDKLFNRLDYFSDKYNLPYKRAVFRCQKTKWGSCSSENNISLNVNIAYLTKELQDYILLHELVHTKIKGHSKKFWAELDRYVDGRAKGLQKKMRRCRMMVSG